MMKMIMQSGATAVALAASVLHAPNAQADAPYGGVGYTPRSEVFRTTPWVKDYTTPQATRKFTPIDYRYNRIGYNRRARLVETCKAAICDQANYLGFHDVDFDSRGRVEQVGRRRFIVYFREVEFEGRRREFERSVSCHIVRGYVDDVQGVPVPGKRRRRHGYRY